MDTLATAHAAFNLREPIPGYLLRERIGAGGYGEVWLADAPGGLTKAVKIVYGPMQDGRAERELKALNRIKLVQHPLLLSLERIEMVSEHLIIVMELAHGSLKDRFVEHVADGQRGIPRAELLAYLRDVADALDYLYGEHSLQHLDVKPENLLLIANRVKVADFGLIKDLGDRSASLVGGLTPLYAPPEVFDGRPNCNSDQYSLAMVYQELLTGEPAFAGRTAAQLAAQHLHSSPCLAPLPTSDQPVIARALSKDPDRRFPSCRALIDSLTEAPKASSRIRRVATESSRITPVAAPLRSAPVAGQQHAAVSYPVPIEVRDLPAPGVAPEAASSCRPAVFIGIGGTGARVMRSLRARLCARFGNVDAIPSFQMLLLDTDTNALNDAARGDRSSALRPSQLVPIALRQPQEYRSDANNLLEWLNRRWLFNIPRSLTTEGIRPLGRLALVDHFEKVANVLHHALSSVLADASLASSSRTTGLRFVNAPPRIFVVASAAGGVGSGLVLDLGYLLRTMLEELHISDEQLHGVLVHSTSRRTNQRDLALANSLSLFAELHHYTSDKGYPGEPACKLPPRVGNSAPFRHTYVTHLGDELNDEEFARGAADLGEYLYQSSVTAATSFFDQCRGPAGDSQDPTRKNLALADTVRSFGLAHVGGTKIELACSQANSLCATLVARWAGRQQAASSATRQPHVIDPEIAIVAQKFADGMGLRFDELLTWAQHVVEQELGETPEAFFKRRITAILEQSTGAEARERLKLAMAAVRSELCDDKVGNESLPRRVGKLVASAAVAKRRSLRSWFFLLLDAPKPRVSGSQDAVRWVQAELEELESQLAKAISQLLGPTHGSAAHELRDIVLAGALTELQRFALDAALQLVHELKLEVRQCEDQLHDFARRILHLAKEFAAPREAKLDAGNRLVQLLQEHHLELTNNLERELTRVLLHKHLTLSELMNANSDAWADLVTTMRSTAQRLAGSVISRLQVSSVLQGTGEQFGEGPANTAATVQAALPRLRECGGDSRFLLVPPQSAGTWPDNWKQPFDRAAGVSTSVAFGTDDTLVVCCETQRVPLRNIAAHLIGTRSDLVKVANRLHTRIDVDWPSLEGWLSKNA